MMSVENGSLTCEKPRNLTVLLKLKIVQLYFFSFLRGGRIYQIYTFHSEIIKEHYLNLKNCTLFVLKQPTMSNGRRSI